MTVWESVIKIAPTDSRARQARDIADGIGYACALLMDEYNWSAEDIDRELARISDDAYDQQEQRRNGR